MGISVEIPVVIRSDNRDPTDSTHRGGGILPNELQNEPCIGAQQARPDQVQDILYMQQEISAISGTAAVTVIGTKDMISVSNRVC